ncbi:Phosphoglucosamine mutase [Frankliniella fusca]|uniref:Phosphoglucosamine mutase n=1 Tax=Frankliniella fusca TaxID=407009 RepID=A0AAE1GR63_9NEOP|nr:Phosphoglucosamine mutase [Frankliniella fusca]
MYRAGATGLAPSWPWLLALGLACVASVAPLCEGLGQHAVVHGQGLGQGVGQAQSGHLPHDRHATAAATPLQPLQPPQPQQQPDKKLHVKRAVSAALGPRLRRQLRFAEAPADEDDADEMGAAMAAERWLRHPGGGGGGGPGGGMAAARALGLDDFPPPPPHPKHLLYNAVLPSLPLRKRNGLDTHGHGHHAGPYEEFGPSENMLRSTRGNRQYDVPQIGE